MRLAALFHVAKLFEIELLVFDVAPIVIRVIHWETGREGTIRADNQPVLAGAATPVLACTAHESLHILQARDGIHHLVALPLFVDQPIE